MNHWIWVACWIGLVVAAASGALLVLRKESHRGLGWALLVAAVSLAIGGAALNRLWSDPASLWALTHVAAGLSLGWVLVCIGSRRHLSRIAGGHDADAVMRFFALACGMVATIIVLYVAVFESMFRVFALGNAGWRPFQSFGYALAPLRPMSVPAYAFADLGAVIAAGLIALRLTRERSLGTAVFWLAILASLWAALLGPAVRQRMLAGRPVPLPAPWPIPFMVCGAAAIGLFVAVHHVQVMRRRRRAWPGNLEALLRPPPFWPGFVVSAGVVAVAILVLGCLFVTSPGTMVAAFVAAIALFFVVYHEWHPNLAETAMALLTLAVVAASMIGVSHESRLTADYPAILRRVLVSAAVMVFFWHWLSLFWRQQLDDGLAWTTSGRMIPISLRCGFMVAAIGTYIAFQLAAWPAVGVPPDADASRHSWAYGLIAIAMLVLALLFAASKCRKITLAWLSLLVVFAAVVFMHYRSRGGAAHLWASRHGPLLLAATAPLVALMPRLLRIGPTSPYREVLPVASISVVPIGALLLLFAAEYSELAGRWITPTTVGLVAAWYLAAFLWLRRRLA